MKRIEILFRKILLQLLLLSKKEEKKLPFPIFNSESKVLFIRLNRIGDALVSTPLLKFIKEEIGCKVYVLASKNNHFVFNNPLLSDEVIIYDKKRGISSLIKYLNKLNFDAVVDLHDDISTTVSYLISGLKCNYKLGLSKGTNKLYTNTILRLNPKKYHIVERINTFTQLFGKNHNSIQTNIVYSPTEESQCKAKEFIEEQFSEKKFLLGINISAGNEARFWGTNNYKKLISVINSYDVNIILMCMESDLKNAGEISEGVIPVFYNPDFDKFSAMIDNLNLLFTPDTSIVHIGSAFLKPIFGLYVKYNTQDMIWSPYKSPFDCIITEEPTLKNVKFELVKEKFIPFFEKFYYEYSTKSN